MNDPEWSSTGSLAEVNRNEAGNGGAPQIVNITKLHDTDSPEDSPRFRPRAVAYDKSGSQGVNEPLVCPCWNTSGGTIA